MIKVESKIKLDTGYALSLIGDVERVQIGDVITDDGTQYRIESIGMTHFHDPKDFKNNVDVKATII